MANPLVAATPQRLCTFIAGASQRLVVVAPAVNMAVAKVIASQWKKLGVERVTVTLDPDPEVYRLGYGDFEALALLEETGRSLGGLLQCQPGMRLSIIIADEQVMVHAPTPALVQAGPRESEAPNALMLTSPPAALEAALGHGKEAAAAQEIGLDKTTKAAIDEVRIDLELNPPQAFDIARRVRVFNAAFQFVSLEMTGTNIGRRTIKVPGHLMGVADEKTQRELRTSMRILPEGHALSGEELDALRRDLEKRHLRVIKGFGYAVLRSQRASFDDAVKALEERVKQFQSQVREKIAGELDARVQALEAALLPRLLESPPTRTWLLSGDQQQRADQIRQNTRDDLSRAVGSPDDYVRDMQVRVIYRDVAYESLINKEFMTAAREAFPELPQLHQEYDASAAQSPRREHLEAH